jgi:hypothetical protein
MRWSVFIAANEVEQLFLMVGLIRGSVTEPNKEKIGF